MKTIDDTIDFDKYFEDQEVDSAKVKPASSWVDAVVDNFYGETSQSSWQPTGFDKMGGKFDLRPGELTLWAGVNGMGKTTLLSNIMLNVMRAGQRVCMASLEMPPHKTMAKMTQQAAGVAMPAARYIRGFHGWTDGKLWVYDHVGTVATSRMLAVATYARKELQIDHLVIDSLMKCGLGTDDYTGQKTFVDGLCSIARDTGLHIHLVCHMRKGETESKPSEKFDVKGASEIVDLADNLVIVWKNVPKLSELSTLETPRNSLTDEAARVQKIEELRKKPDSFVRMAKQRHFSWEGSWAFWFDRSSQQYLESEHENPIYNGLDLDLESTGAPA